MDISDRATLPREDRAFTVDDIEVREEGDGFTFSGTASVVDTPYTVRDRFGEFTETMRAGSFKRTISMQQPDDIRLLVNHDGIPLARSSDRHSTLRLAADPHLRAEAPLDALSPLVQTVRSAMKRRDLDQMSIGMRVISDEWSDDYSERQISEVQLFDVSIVTFPASPTTTAQVRSLDEALHAITADVDEDELRRAIAHLTSLLPAETTPEVDPAVLDAYRKLWDSRLTPDDVRILAAHPA